MLSPYRAKGLILSLVSLILLLWVGLEPQSGLLGTQCAAHNNFFLGHPKTEVGRGTSLARFSLALCYTEVCCELSFWFSMFLGKTKTGWKKL